MLDKKRFLAQRHSISLMDQMWLGRAGFSQLALRAKHAHLLQLLVYICLPIPYLNPHLLCQYARKGSNPGY